MTVDPVYRRLSDSQKKHELGTVQPGIIPFRIGSLLRHQITMGIPFNPPTFFVDVLRNTLLNSLYLSGVAFIELGLRPAFVSHNFHLVGQVVLTVGDLLLVSGLIYGLFRATMAVVGAFGIWYETTRLSIKEMREAKHAR
jgi:hypothetical protein